MGTANDQRHASVADLVGATIAATGITDAFGVLGSGNLVVTNALCDRGARFHHARHEGGAICMADGYARVSGRLGVCSVHQGPGLTNTMTGLTEAAKSRTPLLVLAGEAPAAAVNSNFRIDQSGLVESVGAGAERVYGVASAVADTERAISRAWGERRPVVLMLPIDVQPLPANGDEVGADAVAPAPPHPESDSVARAAGALSDAQRPLILGGRGAVTSGAGRALRALAQRCGALLATSAPAHGLFAGDPYALGISGGFASPMAAGLIAQADLVLLAGASANGWTTRHGALISPRALVVQIDDERAAFGRHLGVGLAVHGDAAATAEALAETVAPGPGWRTEEIRAQISRCTWAAEPYQDAGTEEWIDPRTLSIELERRLPGDKTVVVDSGHSLGYPAMFLSVPDARSWVFPNGFQAVGLGLGNAIGAAIARPDRVTVAALGDGGTFMALPELETAARLGLRLLITVYDDCAYGAEVHHFAPMGHDVSRVQFPDADLAAIARAAGCHGATVRRASDLAALDEWLAQEPGVPLLLDCKVNPTVCAEWLSEAFRGG